MTATSPAGQAPPAAAAVSPGGQVGAGAWEASTADVEQPTMAATLAAMTERMEPPATQVVASTVERMGEQTKVDTSTTCLADVTLSTQIEVGALVMDGSRPCMTATLQEETVRPVPLVAQAIVSEAGRMEEYMTEASTKVMTVEQGSMSAPLTPSASGDAVPVEVSW